MVEFYLILAAVTVVSAGVFWRLMIGSLVMLVAGYMGEAGLAPAWPAFIVGMLGWGYILYEIFAGEAGRVSSESVDAVTLNVIYNVADVVNKIAFVGIIWDAANAATSEKK